jgi:hypothetical protein
MKIHEAKRFRSRGRLSTSASPLSLAAFNPSGNLVDAAMFESFIASNHGLSCTCIGFGARSNLKLLLGSCLAGEPINHEERSKCCKEQNDRHCLIPFCCGIITISSAHVIL